MFKCDFIPVCLLFLRGELIKQIQDLPRNDTQQAYV